MLSSTSRDLNEKIANKTAKVSVIGLGYVGLPLAVQKAKAGFSVIGIERKKERVDMVNKGITYLATILGDELEKVVKKGRLKATQDFAPIAEVDIVCICVPTPLTKNKEPDTQYIESVIDKMLPYLHQDQLIILESTTYPGTTEEVVLPKIKDAGFKIGKDFYLAYSPERIDPGNKKYHLNNTPKVVGGVTPKCTQLAKALYQKIIEEKIRTVSSPRVAEMEKLLENVFRNVNIALVNELAILCYQMGINIWEVIEAAKTKPYGFMPFYPGPGLGGHCIPIDPFYLSWKAKEYSFNTRFIELAGEINERMPYYVVERVTKILNRQKKCLKGTSLLILGVAYKKDVGDLRESPVLKIINLLEKESTNIWYNDPYVPSFNLESKEYKSVNLDSPTIEKQDLVLITTDHTSYDYQKIVDNARLVFDTRNATKNVKDGREKIHLL